MLAAEMYESATWFVYISMMCCMYDSTTDLTWLIAMVMYHHLDC